MACTSRPRGSCTRPPSPRAGPCSVEKPRRTPAHAPRELRDREGTMPGVPAASPRRPATTVQRLDAIQSAQFRDCVLLVNHSSEVWIAPSWSGCRYDKNDKWSTMYGHARWMRVRMGIYVWQVRILLRYHRTSRVLFALSEDFFGNNDLVIKELLTWLMSSTAKASPSIPHTESTQLNSRTQGQMLHTTEQKLYRFYSPYNVELEQILGRPQLTGRSSITISVTVQ